MTRRIIKIIDDNPRYLRRIAVLCIVFACLSITLLADAYAWPAGILSVPTATLGAWLLERAHIVETRREWLAALAAEYERQS